MGAEGSATYYRGEGDSLMDAVLKRDWIDALRSGKYKQVYGTVVGPSPHHTCAIGVLFHIDPLERLAIRPSLGRCIVELNDYERLTFPEIADWIEDNVRGEP